MFQTDIYSSYGKIKGNKDLKEIVGGQQICYYIVKY
jgi:hypothetical protein